jgi:outer membrane lipopolysaccharide assembly protein LptE/RlpB
MKSTRAQNKSFVLLSRSITFCLLIANLSACGFHLAGSSSLPPQLASIHLIADSLDNRQKATLDQQLKRAGASIKNDQSGGAVGLKVDIKVLPDRNLVNTAGSGKTIIRLFHQLSYSLVAANGDLLVEQKTILRQMDIELDSNNLAGLEYEKQSAAILLDQELIAQLIFQLNYL